MKEKNDLQLPDNIFYTDEHVWARRDGEEVVCGITDYAQDQLGEVAFVDLPANGRHLKAHDEFGSIESVKAVNALFMPVAGTITEVNGALEDAPEEVNGDCYGAGWLIRVKPDQQADVEGLLDAQAYRNGLK